MKDLLEKLKELEKRVEALEQGSRPPSSGAASPGSGKQVSPKEFLLARRPSTEVETTFLLGCYAEYILGMDSFSGLDLKTLYRASRVSMPVNINATVDKNIAKGLFVENSEKKAGKKAWAISLSGEEAYARTT